MSDPAIGIGHPVSDPPRRPLMCAPQPRNLMVRYSGFCIRHTDFGIRNSRIGNRGTGISPCHERLPLDEVDYGAVGWAA